MISGTARGRLALLYVFPGGGQPGFTPVSSGCVWTLPIGLVSTCSEPTVGAEATRDYNSHPLRYSRRTNLLISGLLMHSIFSTSHSILPPMPAY